MIEAFNQNRNYGILCFLWILLSTGFVYAQDQKTTPGIEKIYLHTDRSLYFLGEDLWYKAYNVSASNNLLFDNSNILYVELVSPDAKIVARNKTNLEMGLGNGDFQLADSLGVKPGKYQLRAYTNWNRNFGEDFVFKKNIEIIDVFEGHSKPEATKNSLLKTNPIQANVSNNFKIDFFPEGGPLLENVASSVGFKAIDNNGEPIAVKGEIFDSENELITSFVSAHDGMGKFQMIPIERKSYYAKITNLAGTAVRVQLPDIAKQGYLLGFRVFKGKNIITINTNSATLDQNPNSSVTVVCKSRGVLYLETTQTISATTISLELPKDKTPEGISQITLYDSNSKPQSERLVYIEKEFDLEVALTSDKVGYKPNEKTVLNVSSKSKEGLVKSASFSLSVTDMNGEVDDKDFSTNISSYFLMESDIRGKIHDPAYYFDTANLKRFDHLDNLLLTQGWRNFIWKTIPKTTDSIHYNPEKGFTISGRVKQLLGEKSLENSNMTLGLMNKNHFNIFNATTNAKGLFKFENIMFSNKTNIFLNSRNDKGKFRGEIILDPIEQLPIATTFSSAPIILSPATKTIVENVFKKYVAYGVKPENILKEVSIVAKKESSRHPSMIGIPDFSYVADKSTAQYTDIYQLIEQVVPGVIADGDSVRFARYTESPLFIIDSFVAIDKLQLGFIVPEDVIKIDVIRGTEATMYYGADAANGVIAITTKENTGQHRKKEVFHSIKKEVEGFYTARVFYAPIPENSNLSGNNKAAVRNTIYWNPYVHPDKTGNIFLNYYNTKVETKVKVTLEGITAAGIPVVKKMYYTIKK